MIFCAADISYVFCEMLRSAFVGRMNFLVQLKYVKFGIVVKSLTDRNMIDKFWQQISCGCSGRSHQWPLSTDLRDSDLDVSNRSAAGLPRCLSTSRAMRPLWHPISRLHETSRDLAVRRPSAKGIEALTNRYSVQASLFIFIQSNRGTKVKTRCSLTPSNA